MVIASVMGLVGLDVAMSAAQAVFQPDLTAPHVASIWVGLASAAIMWVVCRDNLALSHRTRSKSLETAAFDNRSDTFTSLSPVAGIAGSQLGWRWLDPLAAHTHGRVRSGQNGRACRVLWTSSRTTSMPNPPAICLNPFPAE